MSTFVRLAQTCLRSGGKMSGKLWVRAGVGWCQDSRFHFVKIEACIPSTLRCPNIEPKALHSPYVFSHLFCR